MADKSWTATDLELGSLKINPRAGGELHVERRYQFLDAAGEVLTQIKGGRFVTDVAISSLPAEVIDALQVMDTWTKNQALIQEEMNE